MRTVSMRAGQRRKTGEEKSTADLAQLHEDIDDTQEVGRGKSGAGVAACHVVLIQVSVDT